MLRVSIWRVKSELPPPARGERATMSLVEDSPSVPTARTSATRRGRRPEIFTLGWNLLEAVISIEDV